MRIQDKVIFIDPSANVTQILNHEQSMKPYIAKLRKRKKHDLL